MKLGDLTRVARYFGYMVLAVVAFSCTESSDLPKKYENGSYMSFSAMLNNCTGTTKVIAISEMEGAWSHTKIEIVVVDATNTFYSCRIGGTLGLSRGDTVKFCNNR